MPFYNGTVMDAIANSKSSNKCLLVVVQDEQDANLNTLWGDQVIDQALSACVALKLIKASNESRDFLALYPTNEFPSIFFINPNSGDVLMQLNGNIESEAFLLVLESSVETMKSKHHNPEDSLKTTVVSPKPQLSIQEQKERLQKKIQEKKQQRAEEDKERDKNREKDRIQSGKELQKIQRDREDQQRIRDAEESRKEKERDKLAKEKIKKQIEADKEERRKRLEKSSSSTTTTTQSTYNPTTTTTTIGSTLSSSNSKTTILNFKSSEGENIRNEFNVEQTLAEVVTFLKQTITYKFTLVQPFPRMEFKQTDMNRSLRDLGLVPSASLLISPLGPLPSNNNSSGQASAGGGDLLSPVWGLWNYLMSWFPSGQANSSTTTTTSTSSSNNNANRNQQQTNNNQQRQTGVSTLSDLRKRGSDKNNEYYNGNSTQFKGNNKNQNQGEDDDQNMM